jgi:hypothetical protein
MSLYTGYVYKHILSIFTCRHPFLYTLFCTPLSSWKELNVISQLMKFLKSFCLFPKRRNKSFRNTSAKFRCAKLSPSSWELYYIYNIVHICVYNRRSDLVDSLIRRQNIYVYWVLVTEAGWILSGLGTFTTKLGICTWTIIKYLYEKLPT